jgi:methylmalonyl-CoA mutase
MKRKVVQDQLNGSAFMERASWHSGLIAGKAPFLRGPYLSMYLQKPWTIRQYAGFSTAAESNEFYKKNLAAGQTGLSVAFDLPTHRGYDSDALEAKADVGKAGVAVDTLEDMCALFEGIDLSKVSVSMTMNGAVLPIMAFFIAAAKKQGVEKHLLRGTIQNDILKEFMVRNTYIYPPEASMEIVAQVMEYCTAHLPLFNSISISGYHLQEAGASTAQELAYTLADGWAYVRAAQEKGLSADEIGPRLSFFWGISMHTADEIAKLRAARVLWTRIMQQLGAKNEKSWALKTHCQTSGWSLTAQWPKNNLTRTAVEAISAVLGGTQSLHTNAFDEALALPTDDSARWARNTQLYLGSEAGLTRPIDPLGGSEILEQKTLSLIDQAWEIITEIQLLGGMTQYVLQGTPKRAILEAAAKTQAQIDAGTYPIVGVNTYLAQEREQPELRYIHLDEVLESQCRRLNLHKAQRNASLCAESLTLLKKAALDKKTNLLEAAVTAALNGATLGEISEVLVQVFGRYQPEPTGVSGIYQAELNKHESFCFSVSTGLAWAEKNGRKPKILLAKMGQDGHDRGLYAVAAALSDQGFEVRMTPLFQTPEQVGLFVQKWGADLVSVSSMTNGHGALIPDLCQWLKKHGLGHVKVILGGIIPEKDYESMKEQGVDLIFGPGTDLTVAAQDIYRLLNQDIKND